MMCYVLGAPYSYVCVCVFGWVQEAVLPLLWYA